MKKLLEREGVPGVNSHFITRTSIEFGLRTPGAAAVPVMVDLSYDSHDPYAVRAEFHAGRGVVSWIFARELLADGLLGLAGVGDVRIMPATNPELVLFQLDAADSFALLDAPSAELAEFLDDTYDGVSPGTEHEWFDFDEELIKLGSK
jgi:Streptomyces sporulation and cell division protein, SsgA